MPKLKRVLARGPSFPTLGNKMSGIGRGEAFKRVFPASSSSQKDSATLPQQSTDVPPRAGGRGLFLSRLGQPSGSVQSGDAPAPRALPAMAMGRAKLFGISSSTSATIPSNPPIPRGITERPEHTRVDRAAAESADNSPPSAAVEKLSLAEKADSDSESGVVNMQGTSGTKLTVTCNYVRLRTEPGKGIFQYDVKFKPDIDSLNTRYHVVRQLADRIGDTKSFDGAILYLPVKLPQDVTVLTASLPSDGTEVKVKITFVKSIRMGHSAAVQLYNVLFRRIMNMLGMTLHGRHFFDHNGAKFVPEYKLEIWPGFVTSIQEFEGGVMLCCDASHRVLRTQTVHELMTDMSHLSKGGDDWHQEFLNLVINQRVLTRYNNKVYGIDDVDFKSSPTNTFIMKSGHELSYVDYYKQQYNVDIIDQGQPLLKSKVRSRIKGEEICKVVDLIPELCFLTGMTDTMRADFKVMKSVAQYTRIAPRQRQLALEKFISNINNSKEVSVLLKNWGLSLDSETVSLPARVLQVEDIFFGNGAVQSGSYQADWTRGATSNSVLEAVPFEHWFIICTKRDTKVVDEFVNMCRTVCPKLGIKLHKPTIITIQSDSTQNYISEIQKLMKHQTVQIIVVLLPVSRADKYAAVKKICCVECPVPSQVIITRTIRSPEKLRSVTQKIMLQMNCKLGGTLWSVKIPIKNAMVVGIDSFHDADKKTNSWGAVVASMNADLTRWYSKVYMSGPGIELLDGLCSGITSCLYKYKEANGRLPEQIYVYRDGVGDGQIPMCANYEIPQMVAACIRMEPNYVPKFLAVIVQKRISTRIYAQTDRDFSNPPPGTVMDHSVTRRDMFDFFLVSQNVRQGTVSPTHYVVAHNSTSMDPDKVQRLTYKLTHLYYNWCGTVRVPAPCQYAHKLSSLVGEAVRREADESLADKLYYL